MYAFVKVNFSTLALVSEPCWGKLSGTNSAVLAGQRVGVSSHLTLTLVLAGILTYTAESKLTMSHWYR